MCRALRATLVCELTPPLFVQPVRYSFFLLYLERQLLAEKFLQFVERAVPALSVTVAGLLVRQILVSQTQLGAACAVRELHRYEAKVIFPCLVVIPCPGEDDLLAGLELTVFPTTCHLLAFGIDEI